MPGELKIVLEAAAVITALAVVIRNGVVVAKFIAFLSELKTTIERIAKSAEEALGLAIKATATANDAKSAADKATVAFTQQHDALQQILGRLDERDAARDARDRDQANRLERKVIQP